MAWIAAICSGLSLAIKPSTASAELIASAAAAPSGGLASINSKDFHEWLSYVASDELEGRALYTTGIGLAAAYVQDHLRVWGAKPAGDKRSYLQTVRVLGVKTTGHSTVTVDVAGGWRVTGGSLNGPGTTAMTTRELDQNVQLLTEIARK